MKSTATGILEAVLQSASDRLYPDKMGEAIVSMDSRDCDGDTALHVFIWADETENAILLIENGADVNAVGDMGETPLHVAVRKQNIQVIRALLAAGAKTYIVSEFNQTALDLAAARSIKIG